MKKFFLIVALAVIGLCSFDVPEADARCGGRGRGLFRGERGHRLHLFQRLRERRGGY